MEEDKDLHALLEHAAELMMKAGYSSVAMNIKVAGKEKMYCLMESSVYMAIKRGTPPTGLGPGPKGV